MGDDLEKTSGEDSFGNKTNKYKCAGIIDLGDEGDVETFDTSYFDRIEVERNSVETLSTYLRTGIIRR